jgi:hypothetical protein
MRDEPHQTHLTSLFRGPQKEASNLGLAPAQVMAGSQMVELRSFSEKNASGNFWVKVKTS